ncbi:PLB1 Phospholipase, partial [Amia calva]|nr:PLB1 Phospholipase [Amia calva]
MGEQPAMEDNDISPVVCPTKDCPFLRTHRNSFPSSPQPRSRTLHKSNATPPTPTHTPTSTQNHTTTHSSTPTVPKPLDPVLGSELHCTDHSPSDTPPTSVHYLRPGDIKVVAAIGDSLTAGNGVGANPNNILDVLKQYRGLSWSIGGDQTLNTVTTLPNLLRRFNAALTGFSVGIGNTAANAFLNQAQPGATTVDLPGQVHTLVKLMKQDQRVDFQRDWKLVTVFIGGNDLCDYCTDSIYFSPRNFMIRIQQALDILHKEVPRVFVNLVEPMHITPLRRLHQDRSLGCPTLIVNILCRCVVKPKEGSRELQTLNDLNRAYQRAVLELVDSGRYDTRDDFTVVVQPFFREVVLPLLQDGRPDRTFFTPDCFHLSQKAQSHMARSLWNNMVIMMH